MSDNELNILLRIPQVALILISCTRRMSYVWNTILAKCSKNKTNLTVLNIIHSRFSEQQITQCLGLVFRFLKKD